MKIETLVSTSLYEREDGTIYFSETEHKPIFIYVLYNLGSPIYVGQTMNIKQRIEHHKKSKSFNEYFIITHYYTKEQADIGERAIISAMKFLNPKLQNKNSVRDTKVYQYLIKKCN